MSISGVVSCGYLVEILAQALSTKVARRSKKKRNKLKVFRHEYRLRRVGSGFLDVSSRKETMSQDLLTISRNKNMVTNFTAAILAIMLVAIQLYCMGLYGNNAKDSSATSEKPAYSDLDNTLRSGLMTDDTDFVLSYDLSSSPALLNIDNAMK